MATEKNSLIISRLLKAFVFFFVCLLLLTVARLIFILTFRSQDLALVDFLPAFWVGTRVDAKWLATLLVPAWLVFMVSWKFPRLYALSTLLAILGALTIFILDEVNFGFYGFYSTPINSIVFGLTQDNTQAIFTTLWTNWPVFKYLALLAISIIVPVLAARIVSWSSARPSNLTIIVCFFLITVLIGVVCRGSLGRFPLRYQHFAVTTNTFINASVVNGAAALYEANNARRALDLKKEDIPKVLNDMGFQTPADAEDTIRKYRKTSPEANGLASKPHVVYIVMESMGRDLFDMDDEKNNNTLGNLRSLLDSATIFRNGISINHGTFVSLEGLLFDTPLTPITLTKFGGKTFPFSEVLDFKKAGYKTIFIKGSAESWRQVDVNLKTQGFDEVLGSVYIKSKNPGIEESPWGVGDRWLFKEANDLLKEADQKGEKLFIMIVSTSNHPPYKVPDNEKTLPVDPSKMPHFVRPDLNVNDLRNMMETYQYASNCLAEFLTTMKKDNVFDKSIIAVTGDHNVRFVLYEPVGYWHHEHGVPVFFWIPDEKIKSRADTSQWVSHWDIFPTLKALALNKPEDISLGRNLFSDMKNEGALTFNNITPTDYGFVVGKSGAISLGKQGHLVCYHWNDEKQEKLVINEDGKCTDEQTAMGEAAKAQRALADYRVRNDLLN